MGIRPRLVGLSSLFLNIGSQLFLFVGEAHRCHGRYISARDLPAYTPHPTFFWVYFIGQVLLQVWWLVKPHHPPIGLVDAESGSLSSLLPRHQEEAPSANEDEKALFLDHLDLYNVNNDVSVEKSPRPAPIKTAQVPSASSKHSLPSEFGDCRSTYMPYYVLGNLCMVVWSYAYSNKQLSLAQVSLHIGCLVQFCAIFFALKRASTDALTTIVAKVFAGSGMMYLWKTWGVVQGLISEDQGLTAPTWRQALNVAFPLLLLTIASGPSPTLGLTFVYTLLALYFGQHNPRHEEWNTFFGIMFMVLAVVLVLDPVLTRLSKRFEERWERFPAEGPILHEKGISMYEDEDDDYYYGYETPRLRLPRNFGLPPILESDEESEMGIEEEVGWEEPRVAAVPIQVMMTVQTQVVVR